MSDARDSADSGDDSKDAEYQVGCPECGADSGDLTFSSPQEAKDWYDEPGECANCGQVVEMIVLKRHPDGDGQKEQSSGGGDGDRNGSQAGDGDG
jgi:hypothetical protein